MADLKAIFRYGLATIRYTLLIAILLVQIVLIIMYAAREAEEFACREKEMAAISDVMLNKIRAAPADGIAAADVGPNDWNWDTVCRLDTYDDVNDELRDRYLPELRGDLKFIGVDWGMVGENEMALVFINKSRLEAQILVFNYVHQKTNGVAGDRCLDRADAMFRYEREFERHSPYKRSRDGRIVLFKKQRN